MNWTERRSSGCAKIAFACICLLYLSGSLLHADEKTVSGATTPKELLTRAAEAMEKEDFEAFRNFYLPRTPDEIKAVNAIVELHKLLPRVKKFLKAGQARFGEDFRNEVLDVARYELDLALQYNYDYHYALKQPIKESKFFDEVIATGMIGSTDAFGDTTHSSFVLVKREGRWFMDIPGKRILMHRAVEAYVTQAETALEESESVEELKNRIRNLRSLFDEYYGTAD